MNIGKYFRKSQSGMSQAGMLFLTVVLGSIVFVCYQIFPFYYYYYEFQGLMEAQGRKASEFEDHQIIKNLMERINDLELPLEERDIDIRRDGERIQINAYYTEVLWFEFRGKEYTIWEFEFNPYADVRY